MKYYVWITSNAFASASTRANMYADGVAEDEKRLAERAARIQTHSRMGEAAVEGTRRRRQTARNMYLPCVHF